MRLYALSIFQVLSVGLLASSVSLFAADRTVRVCARDERGGAVADVVVTVGARRATSDASGCISILVDGQQTATVEVLREGFQTVTQAVGERTEVDVVLRVAAANTVVDVTAARTPLSLDASASSVRTMSEQQLQEAPGFVLDDRLRQVAGFQLFRRTGSWVANPTTQGTSLRDRKSVV